VSARDKHEVVVVGGGYAGTVAAVRVAGRLRHRANVTLVEPRAELVQRLRLHQAAAGQSIPGYDLDKLTGRRVAHLRTSAYEIDGDRRVVRVSGGAGRHELRFDSLIVAVGSTVDTGSVTGVAKHAHSLADPAAAARLAVTVRHLRAGATLAVCGGGLTGIEAASELADARPDLDVWLLTAGALGDWLSAAGRTELAGRLKRLGVEVREHARVASLDDRVLTFADGGEMCCDAAVWCGGFAFQPLLAHSDLCTDKRGRLLVDTTLRSVSHPHVLGAGDAAAIPALPNGAAFRMTCQAGMPSGAHAADTVAAVVRGREPERFDLGYIHMPISLGRRDGLIQWVDRTDRPKPKVLVGRRAALYKELVTRGAVPSIRMERRMPGTLIWLGGGDPIAIPSPPLPDAAL
jgi:NADH:ubiquinone reductase (H+-translocating)